MTSRDTATDHEQMTGNDDGDVIARRTRWEASLRRSIDAANAATLFSSA